MSCTNGCYMFAPGTPEAAKCVTACRMRLCYCDWRYAEHPTPYCTGFVDRDTPLGALALEQRCLIMAEDGPKSRGLPTRWRDNPKWKCTNGHVSKTYLKSEAKQALLCLACGERVLMMPPEAVEDAPETQHKAR